MAEPEHSPAPAARRKEFLDSFPVFREPSSHLLEEILMLLRRLIADPSFRRQAAAVSRKLAAGLPTWEDTGRKQAGDRRGQPQPRVVRQLPRLV